MQHAGDQKHGGGVAETDEGCSGKHSGESVRSRHDEIVRGSGTFTLIGRNATHQETVEAGFVHPLKGGEGHVANSGCERRSEPMQENQRSVAAVS